MKKYQLRLSIGMHKLLHKFKNVAGDYEDTVIQGVAHYLCDSGIYSDAFSVADAKRIADEVTVEYDSDEWHEVVRSMDLQCNEILDTLGVLAVKYNEGDDADLAWWLAEGERMTVKDMLRLIFN